MVVTVNNVLQLLYINIFDTKKYPGKSWERIDYSDDSNHGKIIHMHKQAPLMLFMPVESP